jgi:hypothetical protein
MNAEPLLVAAIPATGALLGIIWQSRKTRKLNTQEHAYNVSKLDRIEETVEKVSGKVDRLAEQQMRHESVKHRGKRLW